MVCSDVSVLSSFRCSDPVLNWLYDAYIRTQINNFHNGIPSDCPHRERLGYTGDGQLTSETAMLLLDSGKLYENGIRTSWTAREPIRDTSRIRRRFLAEEAGREAGAARSMSSP